MPQKTNTTTVHGIMLTDIEFDKLRKNTIPPEIVAKFDSIYLVYEQSIQMIDKIKENDQIETEEGKKILNMIKSSTRENFKAYKSIFEWIETLSVMGYSNLKRIEKIESELKNNDMKIEDNYLQWTEKLIDHKIKQIGRDYNADSK